MPNAEVNAEPNAEAQAGQKGKGMVVPYTSNIFGLEPMILNGGWV